MQNAITFLFSNRIQNGAKMHSDQFDYPGLSGDFCSVIWEFKIFLFRLNGGAFMIGRDTIQIWIFARRRFGGT